MPKVYLLTDNRYVDPPKVDWYIKQILDDDRLLIDALETHGIGATRVDWDDQEVDWSKADAAIFRTTWDYFERFADFKVWFDKTREKVRFINPPDQILWNLDKHYLQELQLKDIAIVPSLFLEIGEQRSLKDICDSTDWEEFILKPCISAAGFHTYRLKKDELENSASLFRELIVERSMMIQEYQTSIRERGEVSHMVLGGQYTHSILKKAKGEEFRVQDDFGGTVHKYQANQKEIAFAERVFQSCDPLPAYGRVDVMWDKNGQLMVSELEIIEPELWFREHPPSAKVLADYLASIL